MNKKNKKINNQSKSESSGKLKKVVLDVAIKFRKISAVSLIRAGIITIIILTLISCGFGFYCKAQIERQMQFVWQAVFLTNGQVYFGHIKNSNKTEIILTNVYYLRSADNPQEENKPSEFSLVKLGKELHGPTDVMRINRDHILFTEYLRNDSKIVQSISN